MNRRYFYQREMLGVFAAILTVAALPAGGSESSWDRIRYVGGVLSTRVTVDNQGNSATLSSDRLIIRLADGQALEIPTAAVTFVGYSRLAATDDTVVGLPALVAPIPIFYMGWVRKAGLHFVAVDYTVPDGRSARILLQVDKKSYVQMVTALNASTGIHVSMPVTDRKYFPKGLETQTLTQPLRRVPGVTPWRVESLAGHRHGVSSIGFSSDGRLLASASYDGTIIVWNVADRKIVWHQPKQERDGTGIAFGPGGLLASWGVYRGGVTVWDVVTHAVVANIRGSSQQPIRQAALSPDGQMVATLEGSVGSDVLRLWRLSGLEELGAFRPGPVGGFAVFSADGLTLNHCSLDGVVIAWDISSGRRTTLAHVAGYTGIALDSSARWLAASRPNRTLELWDLSQQETVAVPLAGYFGNVKAADFSPDARRLASIAEGHAMVWDVATHRAIGQCTWGAAGGARAEVALSPDGAIVAMAAADDPTIGLCFAPDR